MNKLYKYLLQMLVCVVLAVGLVSCAKKPKHVVLPLTPSMIQHMYAEKVVSLGMSIQHVGQEITIVVPSDNVFSLGTLNYLQGAHDYLKFALDYMRTYDIIQMNVSSYVDNRLPNKVALALTQGQAQRVSQFLWQRFSQLRLITAKGYGLLYPVASNNTLDGRSQNRRIEIHFRYLVNE